MISECRRFVHVVTNILQYCIEPVATHNIVESVQCPHLIWGSSKWHCGPKFVSRKSLACCHRKPNPLPLKKFTIHDCISFYSVINCRENGLENKFLGKDQLKQLQFCWLDDGIQFICGLVFGIASIFRGQIPVKWSQSPKTEFVVSFTFGWFSGAGSLSLSTIMPCPLTRAISSSVGEARSAPCTSLGNVEVPLTSEVSSSTATGTIPKNESSGQSWVMCMYLGAAYNSWYWSFSLNNACMQTMANTCFGLMVFSSCRLTIISSSLWPLTGFGNLSLIKADG